MSQYQEYKAGRGTAENGAFLGSKVRKQPLAASVMRRTRPVLDLSTQIMSGEEFEMQSSFIYRVTKIALMMEAANSSQMSVNFTRLQVATIQKKEIFTELFIPQFSPGCRQFIPLSFKYPPHHPLLKHTPSVFFLKCEYQVSHPYTAKNKIISNYS
jgi:hypothetical protein